MDKLNRIEINFEHPDISYEDLKAAIDKAYPSEFMGITLTQENNEYKLVETIPETAKRIKLTPFITYYFVRLVCGNLFGFKIKRLIVDTDKKTSKKISNYDAFFTTYSSPKNGYKEFADEFKDIISSDLKFNQKKSPNERKLYSSGLALFNCDRQCDVHFKFYTEHNPQRLQKVLSKLTKTIIEIKEEEKKNQYSIHYTVQRLSNSQDIPFYHFIWLAILRPNHFKFVDLGLKPNDKQKYRWYTGYAKSLFPEETDYEYKTFEKEFCKEQSIRIRQKVADAITKINISFKADIGIEQLRTICDTKVLNAESYRFRSNFGHNTGLEISVTNYTSLQDLSVAPIIYGIKENFDAKATIKLPNKAKENLDLSTLKNTSQLYEDIKNELNQNKKEKNMEENTTVIQETVEIVATKQETSRLELSKSSEEKILDLSKINLSLLLSKDVIKEILNQHEALYQYRPTHITIPTSELENSTVINEK